MAKRKRKAPDITLLEGDAVNSLAGMYQDYFLDYASYVILERAVPAIEDGLKPVQRRILHSMRVMEDGRFHKVANIIGHTMQYHPHGDAAIGDALVNLGQKDLLIDTQGNWGDVRTGDSAAASRYIEARLSKFALEIAFNKLTTSWQVSYDGRKEEPITLPVKFPLILAQGVEGIAVGLSTRILPHNFVELIRGSIKILEGKRVKIYPDFPTGGMIDVTDYQGGKRGGKVRVRAKIDQVDRNTLAIRELPYGTTTNGLVDSIIKANDKGKIKIRKLVDNTARDVEILVSLPAGVSPDVTMDALYAFTDCEVSISPNACLIVEQSPMFLTVEEILRISTERTRDLLRQELEIRLHDLEEKWHYSSLEKIFIEKRIYRDIEECETWEAVIRAIDEGFKKYVATPSTQRENDSRIPLKRDITKEDILRMTEIRIKRISKYNSFKADELIRSIEDDLEQVHDDLEHLTDYAINYFRSLLDKYGAGRERKTEIVEFETIRAKQVIAHNAKLYVDRKEGFAGYGMKKDDFVKDCSDIDDIIAFTKPGKVVVKRIEEKGFFGKDILHIDVWKKKDERTTYNMIYVDGKTGVTRAKRFNIKSITRDKVYDLTKGTPRSKIHYFSANPNGEAETVEIQLTPGCKAKKKVFAFDFAELAIKGRGAQGNIITKYPIRKVALKEAGKSTLGAIKIWMDEVSGRLNKVKRGTYLGAFDTGDQILAIYQDGSYALTGLDLTRKFEAKKIVAIKKFDPETVVSAIYYDGERGWTMVKRFKIETSSLDQRFSFITDHRSSKLYFATILPKPVITYSYRTKEGKVEEILDISQFIDVKGWKAIGNKLTEYKLLTVKPAESKSTGNQEDSIPPVRKSKKKSKGDKSKNSAPGKQYSPGDTLEFDL